METEFKVGDTVEFKEDGTTGIIKDISLLNFFSGVIHVYYLIIKGEKEVWAELSDLKIN
jgi:hypothetical protein